MTNCQCRLEEENKSRRHLPAQKRRRISTYYYPLRVYLPISVIRRGMYLSLSISQSNQSIKLVLTLPKIHLIPCKAGCLWGCVSNARIHQEQTYSGNWSLLLRACLTQLKSLARSAFNCWAKLSSDAAKMLSFNQTAVSNYCHVKCYIWCYQGQVQIHTQRTMQWRCNMNGGLSKIKYFTCPLLSQETWRHIAKDLRVSTDEAYEQQS